MNPITMLFLILVVGGVHIKAEVHMDGGYSGIKKQRKNYPLEFKLMIIEEAKRIDGLYKRQNIHCSSRIKKA